MVQGIRGEFMEKQKEKSVSIRLKLISIIIPIVLVLVISFFSLARHMVIRISREKMQAKSQTKHNMQLSKAKKYKVTIKKFHTS